MMDFSRYSIIRHSVSCLSLDKSGMMRFHVVCSITLSSYVHRGTILPYSLYFDRLRAPVEIGDLPFSKWTPTPPSTSHTFFVRKYLPCRLLLHYYQWPSPDVESSPNPSSSVCPSLPFPPSFAAFPSPPSTWSILSCVRLLVY